MKNKKQECIFDHEGFLYVCNFATMTMWVIQEEDDEDPVTTLDIQRDDRGNWLYRMQDSEAEFQIDPDRELVAKVEKFYERFLNTIIVGQNAKTTSDLAGHVPNTRVRAVDRR